MSALQCLIRAREVIAAGWTEPFCRSSSGALVAWDDEAVSRFCVDGALRSMAKDGNEVVEALTALERVATPARAALEEFALSNPPGNDDQLEHFAALCRVADGTPFFQQWLEMPGRPLSHVLRAFDLAILSLKERESA